MIHAFKKSIQKTPPQDVALAKEKLKRLIK